MTALIAIRLVANAWPTRLCSNEDCSMPMPMAAFSRSVVNAMIARTAEGQMRSGIYYPHTTVSSTDVMRSSLLLWDKLHTIAPFVEYEPDYGEDIDLARAWALIGQQIVPDATEKRIAHDQVADALAGDVPPAFLWREDADIYEVWPQKFAFETIDLLQQRGLAGGQLLNGDFPFAPAAGVMVMSKLADAIAGNALARVTDHQTAYAMTPTSNAGGPDDSSQLLVLDVLDTRIFTLDELIAFREREHKEANGRQLTELRHACLAAFERHAAVLSKAKTQRQAEIMNGDFVSNMKADLARLTSEISRNRCRFVLAPVVVATAVTATTAGAGHIYGDAVMAIGAAALGTSAAPIAEKIAKMFDAGFGYSAKQRETMAKHPMAYLFELSRKARH